MRINITIDESIDAEIHKIIHDELGPVSSEIMSTLSGRVINVGGEVPQDEKKENIKTKIETMLDRRGLTAHVEI